MCVALHMYEPLAEKTGLMHLQKALTQVKQLCGNGFN